MEQSFETPMQTNRLLMPQVVQIQAGMLLRAAGRVLRVAEIAGTEKVTLQDAETGALKTCHLEILTQAMQQGALAAVSPRAARTPFRTSVRRITEDAAIIEKIPAALRSPAAIKVMLTKLKWLKMLRAHGERTMRPSEHLQMAIREVEHRTKEKCPLTMSTLYEADRLLKKNNGDVRVLLPRFHQRGGWRQSRLEPMVEQFISDALEAAAKHKGSIRATEIKDSVSNSVAQINVVSPGNELKVPSLPTIIRRINDRFTAYELCLRQYGEKRADRLYRETYARVRAVHPLDVVQYDDTDTAQFLIGRNGLPWGRAWLTVGVSESTGVPLGHSLGERARSRETALEAIINGIFPKNPANPEFRGCKGEWEWYGHHGLIVLDNASYNTSEDLEAGLLEFGSEVGYARPHHPTDKSDIEHFNHRLKAEFISEELGWVGPKEDRAMLDRGLETAVWTFDDFHARLMRWMVDVYANKPLYKTGKTPREMWREAFQLAQPLLPLRQPSQQLVGTIRSSLRFRDSGGLKRMELRYNSKDLEVLRKKMGHRAEVEIRYHPRNLSYIFVKNPFTSHYLRVDCIEDARYVDGLTNFQQRLILAKVRLSKARNPNIEKLVEARDALVKETAELSKSKSMQKRKRAQLHERAGLGADPAQAGTTAYKATVTEEEELVSELELMTRELESRPISRDAEPVVLADR